MSTANTQSLDWLQSQKESYGFLDVGFTSLKPDPHFIVYEDWLSKGYHGPLEYMTRNNDKREDPRRLGEGLKSAFVFLFPYPNDFSSPHIARYAQGEDYHHAIKEKLFALSEKFHREVCSLDHEKICIDTVPLLERSLAIQAGLGWSAKNSCLLNRKHGSFHFIACWLTSLDLVTHHSANSNHCGTCTRCLDACPTDAFAAPGILNAQQCLSTKKNK
ncbi:MAG: DUF1730 domain-containing protein, partial [Planctomycetes bacterium]|nr:DUF1730 domain-containing protein [Planctomycetota bacterium]